MKITDLVNLPIITEIEVITQFGKSPANIVKEQSGRYTWAGKGAVTMNDELISSNFQIAQKSVSWQVAINAWVAGETIESRGTTLGNVRYTKKMPVAAISKEEIASGRWYIIE